MNQVNELYPHEKKCLNGYSRQATIYDSERFESFNGVFRKELVFRIIDEQLKSFDSEELKILDAATGTGICALYLADKKKNAIVHGIDLTENMLKEARKKSKALNLINVYFEQGNIRNLPYADNTFDVVISLRFFHHIPNKHRSTYIQEMLRVTKPGGILILEFKNFFYGGIVGLIKHYILRIPGGHYLYPHQISVLFRGIKVREIIGLYLPFIQIIAKVNKQIAFGILKLARYFPLNFLSSDSYVICNKYVGLEFQKYEN